MNVILANIDHANTGRRKKKCSIYAKTMLRIKSNVLKHNQTEMLILMVL